MEYPEDFVIYRPRKLGGLGLINIKYKAMAELIRSFRETSINPAFKTNMYHLALFKWHIETNPYLSEEIFANIKLVKEEGLLNICKMSSGTWYRVLLENNITMVSETNSMIVKPCRAELASPQVDWVHSWHLATLHGLSSENQTFLWKMLHNILPTQQRLHRMGMRNAISSNCTSCSAEEPDTLAHALISCNANKEVSEWMMKVLQTHLHGLLPSQLVQLDLGQL